VEGDGALDVGSAGAVLVAAASHPAVAAMTAAHAPITMVVRVTKLILHTLSQAP
jgi:hypothetical protein